MWVFDNQTIKIFFAILRDHFSSLWGSDIWYETQFWILNLTPHIIIITLQWLMWARVIKNWGRTLVHFLFSSRPRQLEPDRINFSKKWFNHFCEKWNWFPIEDYLDTLLGQQVWDNNVSNGMIPITVLMNLFIKYFHGRSISQLIIIKGV